MSQIAYTKSYDKLKDFFSKIQEVKPPKTATVDWLKQIGFKSSYDQSMLRILDSIGFRDAAKKPTDSWKLYRNGEDAPRLLAKCIRKGYGLLYDTYSDAHGRDVIELKNIIRPGLDLGEDDAVLAVETFKVLCSMADFETGTGNGAAMADNGSKEASSNGRGLVQKPQDLESEMPTLHIDIQVHIAADAPESQIDKIFESMAKHLYGKTVD